MKKITLITVAAVAALAFAGCAEKKSCGAKPVVVKAPTPVAVKAPAPVAAPAVIAPVVVPQEVESVVVPYVDAKESAVQ